MGLGFRRLSVIDLVHGDQPLSNETGSVVAICNGEIYNFRELGDNLIERGHTLSGGSDIAVLPHLYEEHSVEFVHDIQGMFACAIWDRERHRLVLAIDRLGVKPLYWTRLGDGLIFGSEPGAILASGLISASPDPKALIQYLALQYVPAPMSGFLGVNKLAPGERLVFEGGVISTEPYWDLAPAYEQPEAATENEAIDALDELLSDATRSRLTADVPLGAFLSGGIDSSLVVSYMAECLPTVSTYSIDVGVTGFGEGPHARRVASLYGTRHEEFVVEPEMVPTVAAAARAMGEPFADSSSIPTYLLSEMARRRVTVALSGDGGDEAFAGYVRYAVARNAERFQRAAVLTGRAGLWLDRHGLLRSSARLRRGLEALSRSPHDRYAGLMVHFDPAALTSICEPEFLLDGGGAHAAWDDVLALPALDGVNKYLALDVATYLPGDLLTKVDRMSMAHGLEVRSPLLDYRLHEFAARLPDNLKLRGTTTKWLLKRLARRRGLPADLVERPKQGLGIPLGYWLRTTLSEWLKDTLLDDGFHNRGYFVRSHVEEMVASHLDGSQDNSTRLWNLMMLELWHGAWIDA